MGILFSLGSQPLLLLLQHGFVFSNFLCIIVSSGAPCRDYCPVPFRCSVHPPRCNRTALATPAILCKS